MHKTRTHELIERHLGSNLHQYVNFARAHRKSWESIAVELWTLTGIPVSGETLRTWFGEEKPVA